MSAETDAINYALSKQVPAMTSGCTISTNYGEICLTEQESKLVGRIVRLLLNDRLRAAEQEENLDEDI